VYAIYSISYLTLSKLVRPLIMLSFNPPKPTNGLDALSCAHIELIVGACLVLELVLSFSLFGVGLHKSIANPSQIPLNFPTQIPCHKFIKGKKFLFPFPSHLAQLAPSSFYFLAGLICSQPSPAPPPLPSFHPPRPKPPARPSLALVAKPRPPFTRWPISRWPISPPLFTPQRRLPTRSQQHSGLLGPATSPAKPMNPSAPA
jgi:hypothetical protein